MPTIKTKPIRTSLHLGNSVRYLGDADHPAHSGCMLESVTILNNTPVGGFAAAVEANARLYNLTVETRNAINTLATAYFFNFAAGSNLTAWERAAYSSRMKRVICWDNFAAECWHLKEHGGADYNLLVPTVLSGALAPRRTRNENLMSILRKESDKVVDSLNGLRAKGGTPPIPTVAATKLKPRRGAVPVAPPVRSLLAVAAARLSLQQVGFHHLPTLLNYLGFRENEDWEIDFLMRLRFRRRGRKDGKRATVIPVHDLLKALNTLPGQQLALKNQQQNQQRSNETHTDKKQESQHRRDHGRPHS